MRRIRALIVEDEPPTARFIKALVEQEEDFEVAGICERGEDALKFLGAGCKADLVLSDIRMAQMDGLELLKAVRRMDQNIYMIIISGYKMFEYAKEAIRLNIEDYITKPIEPGEFSQVLGKVRKQFQEEERLRRQDCLEKALRYKSEKGFREGLGGEEAGITAIYMSGGPGEWIGQFNTELPDILSVTHREILLLFYEAGKTPPVWKVLNRLWAKTCTVLEIKQAVFRGDGIRQVKRICHKVQELTVLGKRIKKSYDSLEQIEGPVSVKELPLSEKVRMNIRAQNWEEILRGVRKQFEEWEGQEESLYRMRYCLRELGEVFREGGILSTEGEVFQEEILDGIRYADSYEELRDSVLELFREQLADSQRSRAEKKEMDIFSSILSLIDRNMEKNYSLSEICQVYGVSQPYIRKIFRKYTHCTYSKYVSEKKIAFAKQLIESNPDILIKDVAEAVGVETFYFSNIFSKSTGMTPSEYKILSKENK